MKRALICFAAALLLLCFAAQAQAAEHIVRYYYINYCEACTPEEDFAEEFRSLTGLNLADCDYRAYNVVRADGQTALREAGFEEASLPAVTVDGVLYEGAAQMRDALVREALTWGESTDSTVIALHVPACESCARAETVLQTLPEEVTFLRGSVEITSKVRIVRMDASEDPQTAMALFERYNVPDDARITPIVFYGDHFLSGAEAIEKHLLTQVEAGRAVGTFLPEKNTETTPRSMGITLFGALGAGIAAGFNTCALSMLLLVLTLLLDVNKGAGRLAAVFLATKFVCYLLIGFVLLRVLQRFDPSWLRPTARIVLTVLGAVLIVLNLSDAWQAHRGEYGKVKNQLPSAVRGRLHGFIRKTVTGKTRFFGMVLLGAVIACGEFLCAGQLYLMQLLAAVRTDGAQGAVSLVVYCAAFILPAGVVTVLLLCGKSKARASAFFAEHMDAVKLLTALVMAALVVLAWIL